MNKKFDNRANPGNLGGIRGAIHESPPTLAALLAFTDPGVATVVGRSGFDAVILDAEHGPFTLETLRHSLSALESTPAYSMIRVAVNDPALIKQVLELGPDAIVAPAISSGDEATAFVSACRYPPDGTRGVGTGRASSYGLDEDYGRRANRTTAALAMVETAAGTDDIEAICSVAGLDGIFIGPTDLAASLNVPLDSPELEAAIDRITSAATAAGVPVGTNAAPEDIGRLIQKGMSLFVCFADYDGLATSAAAAVDLAREDSKHALS